MCVVSICAPPFQLYWPKSRFCLGINFVCGCLDQVHVQEMMGSTLPMFYTLFSGLLRGSMFLHGSNSWGFTPTSMQQSWYSSSQNFKLTPKLVTFPWRHCWIKPSFSTIINVNLILPHSIIPDFPLLLALAGGEWIHSLGTFRYYGLLWWGPSLGPGGWS